MLVPALVYKDELLKRFALEMYSDRYFYYAGWRGDCRPPEVDSITPGAVRWAIVDQQDILGYFAYFIDYDTNCVDRFGLYSFEDEQSIMRNASILGKDIFGKLDELVKTFHRVSWRVVGGNPVIKSYDNFLLRCSNNGYKTTRVELHDVCKDLQGQYRGEIIYEVINDER